MNILEQLQEYDDKIKLAKTKLGITNRTVTIMKLLYEIGQYEKKIYGLRAALETESVIHAFPTTLCILVGEYV